MRVSNKAVYDSINFHLSNVSDAMLQANEVVSTEKRINQLSDDPVGMVSVLNLRSSIEYIHQLERNITMGRTWLNMGETVLSQVEEILGEAKALTVTMSSDTQGATERANAAEQVDGYFQQILALANTQVDGRYIFSGTKTDTAPFELGTDGSGNTTVTYQGNDTEFAVNIAKDINVDVGRDGEDIFGDDTFDWGDASAGQDNIFKTLLDLKDDLLNNNQDGVLAAMDELDSQLDTISALIADTGSKINRLDLKENIIQDLELTYTDRMSAIEDVDIAEAILNLEAKELAYKAALASSTKVLQLSLVDYL